MMDPDGDGTITLEEFKEFWKEQEIDQLVDDMDTEEVQEALQDIGVDTNGGVVSQVTMRERPSRRIILARSGLPIRRLTG